MENGSSGDTTIRVYTSNLPPNEPERYIKRSGRLPERENLPKRHTAGRRLKRPAGQRRPKLKRPAGRKAVSGRLAREAAAVCAVLMAVMSVRAMPFEWARRATAAMSEAVSMSVDLDKTLGQLRFVKAVIPDASMVFQGGRGDWCNAFEGVVTHNYTKAQPWLEYSGRNQLVLSVRAGRIKQLEQGAAGDWAVRVEHDEGMETVYAFLSEVSVREGDSVTCAQPIGRAAGTNGARIYFEMRRNGEPIDPSAYLGAH